MSASIEISTTMEVFLVIEAVVLVVGGLMTWLLEEMAKLLGLVVLVYGTGIVFVAFFVVSFIHDHIGISIK